MVVARKTRFAILAVAAGCMIALLAGFVVFASSISRTQPETVEKADGIVVLTGGAQRITDAIGLLDRTMAKRLLITGVNPRTTKEELSQPFPDKLTLFDCCIDIDRQARNTIGNAEETRDWVERNDFSRIIVVTGTYHMPRSLMELQSALPKTELFPYPVIPASLHLADWWYHPQTIRLLWNEYLKLLAARLRLSTL